MTTDRSSFLLDGHFRDEGSQLPIGNIPAHAHFIRFATRHRFAARELPGSAWASGLFQDDNLMTLGGPQI
jgi:hypothetical protein